MEIGKPEDSENTIHVDFGRFLAILNRAFGVNMAIIVKWKLLRITKWQFAHSNYCDFYAECSKITKNGPKSTWGVFSESSDFAVSKNFRFFDHLP